MELLVKKCGEEAGVNKDEIQSWCDGPLHEILNSFTPSNIFNIDETGLFWKMLLEQSLGFSGTEYHGTKRPKMQSLHW